MLQNFCLTCGHDMQKYHGVPLNTCPKCHCSFNKRKAESTFSYRLIAVGVATLFSFGVLLSWGQYAGKAVPAHAKHILGIANGNDYARLAEVCTVMKDLPCVAKMLELKIQKDPGSIEALAELGRVQFRIGRYDSAIRSLRNYLAMGGTDINARFRLGQALARNGQAEQALSTYKDILNSRPDSVMYPVAEEYVNLLIQKGQRTEAIKAILQTRKKSFSASNFMDNKYREMAFMMNDSTNRLPASSRTVVQ